MAQNLFLPLMWLSWCWCHPRARSCDTCSQRDWWDAQFRAPEAFSWGAHITSHPCLEGKKHGVQHPFVWGGFSLLVRKTWKPCSCSLFWFFTSTTNITEVHKFCTYMLQNSASKDSKGRLGQEGKNYTQGLHSQVRPFVRIILRQQIAEEDYCTMK